MRVFGLDPARDEVAVKSRLAYVPDQVAFYPWMTVRDTLDYFAVVSRPLEPATEQALLDAVPARSPTRRRAASRRGSGRSSR